MSRILDPDSPEVDRLLLAMGGAGPIRSVRTMLRETRTWRRVGSGPPRPYERTVTHRAAGGKIRVEIIPCSAAPQAGDPGGTARAHPGLPRLLVVSPSTRPRTPEDRTGHPDLVAAALRDARLEPRNLLAHIGELNVSIRTAEGVDESRAGIEIELLDERAVFTFDSVTGLCTGRRDYEAGLETAYFDWRFVKGINTPFLEIERGGGFERSLLAIAYDLPLPNTLFETIIEA